MAYKVPPADILAAADAPLTPFALVSPGHDRVLFAEYQMHVPIEIFARPFLKLAGARIDPALHGRQRLVRLTGFEIHSFDNGEKIRIEAPEGGTLSRLPSWAPDGSRFAFTVDTESGIELWIADPETGNLNRLGNFLINDSLVPMLFIQEIPQPFEWLPNGSLVARLVSKDGEAPTVPAISEGPRIEETAGKRSQMATFQDLLATRLDEDLFEFYGTSQLAIIDPSSGEATLLGEPGIYSDVEVSPSGEFLLVTQVHRPFSYRVPYEYFSRRILVWDLSGREVARIAELGVSDEVPRQGVPTGPRRAQWQQNRPSTVVWVEALDGGDPTVKVTSRDRLMRMHLPSGKAEELFDIKQRFIALQWLEGQDEGLYTEWDRDRRWRTTYLIDFTSPDKRRSIIDISMNEQYGDPGWPATRRRPDGSRIVVQEGSRIYLSGQGQTPERARPFLRTVDLYTLEFEELFRSDDDCYETPAGFASPRLDKILTRRESPTDSPNFFVLDLDSGVRQRITDYADPHPQLTGVKKKLVRYKRGDGVELSAMLHLPPGYGRQSDAALPVLIWAYPFEYSDPDTAGQVTGSDMSFTRVSGASPLWMLMRGWAVLMDAKMPVIGDPETMNDTYIEQVVDSAKAAVDALVELGVGDPKRFAVSGHSYGGFMTANLLAHSDLFAAGVARSAAYNRSLTPFGFQNERRSYWEVPHIYQRVSPFNYADQITAPLLLIHGAEDNNSGTFPVQSERLFQAIQGNGGTARLVILPHESHGYLARESILHVIAETIDWLSTHVSKDA